MRASAGLCCDSVKAFSTVFSMPYVRAAQQPSASSAWWIVLPRANETGGSGRGCRLLVGAALVVLSPDTWHLEIPRLVGGVDLLR